MTKILVEVFLGIMYASLAEYLLHKYVLHGQVIPFTKNFYYSHWHIHHNAVIRYGFYDPNYTKPFWAWNERGRELAGIVFLLLCHLPLAWSFLPFFLTLCGFGAAYVVLHRWCHLRPAWGKKALPWHYHHHLVNQKASWNVVLPIWDLILNTRYFDQAPPTYKKKKKNG